VQPAEEPLQRTERLGAVIAPAPWPGVLKRPGFPLQRYPSLPLAAAERIPATAAKSISRNGSVNQKEMRQCR
jgi:hypothetical protein